MEDLEVMNSSETVQEDTIYTEVKDPYGFIYITTNLVNGKRYLCQKRFGEGPWIWKDYIGSGNLFRKAVEKYGAENFSRNIILTCNSAEELNKAEYELSIFFDVVNSDDWYNLVFGGGASYGWHPSEETREKISEAAKERLSDPTKHPCYGKPGLSGERNPQFGISPKERMDEETYNQWYEKHKYYWTNPITKGKHIWADKPNPNLGKKMSESQKEILSKKAKERFLNPENHPMYGKHHTEESKKKMSEFRSSPTWWKCKLVYCEELDEIFYSGAQAHKKYGFDSSGVIKCCRGKRKFYGKHPKTEEKLHWYYVYDQVETDGTVIKGAITRGYITEKEVNNYFNSLKDKGD